MMMMMMMMILVIGHMKTMKSMIITPVSSLIYQSDLEDCANFLTRITVQMMTATNELS